MPKVKERSHQLRNKIVKEYEAGKGYKEISMPLNVPVSSVQFIFKKWKEQGAVTNKPKMGVVWKKYPKTSRKELLKELASTGVNVTQQTLINTLRRERLQQAPSEEDSSSTEEPP